jgi:hypothetical protein
MQSEPFHQQSYPLEPKPVAGIENNLSHRQHGKAGRLKSGCPLVFSESDKFLDAVF